MSSFRAAQVSTDAGPVLSPRTLARAARFSRRLKESNERERCFSGRSPKDGREQCLPFYIRANSSKGLYLTQVT